MTHHARLTLLMLATVLVLAGCGRGQSLPISAVGDRGMLVGAWRSKMVFRSGPLAAMKDLEFLYAYNLGGTMTESSNYDEASNSSPPAYGLWRQIGARTFETKYMFYTTREPDLDGGAASARDWWPSGHGVLTERITLSDDGQTYASTVKLTTYDMRGAPIAPDAVGTGAGTRIVF